MCGINFILDKSARLPDNLIGRMNAATRHRGMDNTCTRKFWSGGNPVYLGANRLRIVDQNPASDQPMVSASGKSAIIFSGEIYNHRDLRRSLERKGIRFHTQSDTETLLYYLQENGSGDLDEIEGMFAFVFFDEEKNIILAGRDRHGMKPLFYSDNTSALIFSSETRGIISTGIIDRNLSKEAINDYLRYRYIVHPKTIYSNIYQVKPGCLISYDLNNNSISQSPYIRYMQQEPISDEKRITREAEELIFCSLKKHLESSKPAGLMLSGGVDSTLLLAIARENGLDLQYTFSVLNQPDEKSFGTEDFRFVARVRKKFNLENHHEIPAGRRILHRLPELIRELDMPVGDPAYLTTGLLAGEACGKAGVLISGAGADEYFGGYNRHVAYEKYLKYRVPARFAGLLNPVLKNILYTGKSHPYRKKFRLIKKLIGDIDGDPMVTYDNFMSSSGFRVQRKIRNETLTGTGRKSMTDMMNNALARDRNEYLVDDILLMSEQIMLYYGIEIRSPYLDNSLTACLQGADPFLILRHGSKWILKKLLRKYGFPEIASRPKEGFGIPFGLWIREKEFDYLRNNLTDNKNPLFEYADSDEVGKLVNLHFSNREDHSNSIFSLLTLSEWLKTN